MEINAITAKILTQVGVQTTSDEQARKYLHEVSCYIRL